MNIHTLLQGLRSCLLLASLSLAAPTAELSRRDGAVVSGGSVPSWSSGSPCGEHGATNRACWGQFNINTDYEAVTPPFKNIRRVSRSNQGYWWPQSADNSQFNLEITNVTNYIGPDGVAKPAMLINGVFPPPPIIADWGDLLQITVHNKLTDNGTSIHWHGLRQFHSNEQDGANGVTECPIPPGASKTYEFLAQQYGTTWYHSHFTAQYGNGIVGTIQINGPASADYDTDLGVYPITDWYYESADRLQRRSELVKNGPPPKSDNILFNGTNINPLGPGGSYSTVTLEPGKKHRLRLINTSVDNGFTVSLVGHTFTVIATDFVPVKPVNKTSLFMGVGQRYDVIIEANQKPGNYWFNATLASSGLCGTSANKAPAAIFSYGGCKRGLLPTVQGTPLNATCLDTKGFTPIVTRSAPKNEFNPNKKLLDVVLEKPTIGNDQVFRWRINGSDINIEWDKPILEYVSQNNHSWPTHANVFEIPDADVWTWWVVENTGALPHPIHLHGHDFLYLGTGSGAFDQVKSVDSLNFENPTRRDVAMLPSSGWLAIAFKTDNPGAWLMHCHIAWHVSQGLSVQFLERKSEIPNVINLKALTPTCDAWRKYTPDAYYPKADSGL